MNKTVPRFYICLWLFSLMGIFTFLALHGANRYAYSPDEAMLTEMAGGDDIAEVLKFSSYESHPPLGNLIRHAWIQFGNSPSFIRSESLLFGLTAILLYYAIGKLLAGDRAGMFAALIVAGSRGLIIRSSVARNYIFFFVFISACFYYFLKWRKDRRPASLAAYMLFGCLAGATHFSALFTIFCMGSCETVAMLRRKAQAREWVLWLAANAATACVIGLLYRAWLPILKQLSLYFSTAPLGLSVRLQLMLLNPLGLPLYLFPGIACAIPLTFAFIICAVWPGSILRKDAMFRFLLGLAVVGILLGMIMFITDVYSPVGGRHNLWLFPFLIPLAGWTLGDACARIAHTRSQLAALMTVLFLGYLALYNERDRFADASEYGMTRKVQADVERFFTTLTQRDRLILERDDAVMFYNIYPQLGDTPFTGTPRAMLTPYLNTQILYDPFMRRLFSEQALSTLFKESDTGGMLKNTDRLVFFYSLWPHSIAAQLMLCPQLEKQIAVFPPLDHPPGNEEIHQAQAVLMTVSARTFLDEVLPVSGKAHTCLNATP